MKIEGTRREITESLRWDIIVIVGHSRQGDRVEDMC